jgi:hypothetical protein
VDYCLRLWKKGLRVVFNPESILIHHESSSSGSHRFLWPSVLRNLAVLRGRYRKQLDTAPEYGVAPVSSLDGWSLRDGYLLLVDSIESALRDDAIVTLVEKMLAQKFFVSIYPLIPWTGERRALKGIVPDEVEVVGRRGIEDFEAFSLLRKNIYTGAICLSMASAVKPHVSRLRESLPRGCIFPAED